MMWRDMGWCGRLGIVIAGLWATTGSGAESPGAPREIQLTECRIKLIDQIVLASDRAGILKFVEPREGDYVRANQRVAGLDDDLVRAELAAAEHKATNDIEIRAGHKARELADTEYDKSKQANRDVKNTVPLIELQRLKLAAEKSVLEIELAQHEFLFNRLQRDIKRQELATFSVDTPIGGLVTKVYRQRGEAVRQGDPILEVTNTDKVRVEGWVDLAYAWQVSVGNRVFVQLNVPDVDLPVEQRKFEGKITFVDASVQPVTRQMKVMAEVVNQDRILRAGLTADMTVRLDANSQPGATSADLKTAASKSSEEDVVKFRRMERSTVSNGTP